MIETAFVGQISQQPQVLTSNTDLHLIKFCLNKQQHDGLQFGLTFRLKHRTVLQKGLFCTVVALYSAHYNNYLNKLFFGGFFNDVMSSRVVVVTDQSSSIIDRI